MAIHEYTIIAKQETVDVDGTGAAPLLMNAEVYNGDIPGPTLELEVGDTAVVRLINDLPHPTGIHWHGIELHNSDDGTPVTQYGVPGAPLQTLGNSVPAGGTYQYRFTVTRPGIFWYHPHHFHSTNRTFRGLYGMIVVRDPIAEAALASILPTTVQRLVLSDATICKAPGGNDTTTYPAPVGGEPEWLSGATAQLGPTPEELCETAPMDEEGNAGVAFAAGDVPNIQINTPGRSVEGQTVLVNGRTVVSRGGTPAAPDPLASGSITVQPGQGLRLQIVNCAVLRYFRLHLSDAAGNQIRMRRIGGEGGLLNEVVEEGGSPGGFATKYTEGEILLPPSTRADVVVAIPDDVSGVLTIWTRDFQRTGGMNPGNWAMLPTVPVFHIEVAGAAIVPPYSLAPGDALLSTTGAPLSGLGAATGSLLDPTTFGEVGTADPIGLGPGAGINGVPGAFSGFDPYTTAVHLPSSRWARDGNILHLAISNDTGAHHPFHLHGFSFQPVSIVPKAGGTALTLPLEFRDSQDIPPQHILNLRVHLADRVFPDGTTTGGSLGRWLFHCHIFFHAHLGMLAELVVTDAGGSGLERPHVDVGGSWAYANLGGIAERRGTWHHRDGLPVALSASVGVVTQDFFGPGTWRWVFDTTGEPAGVRYVYITGEDPGGRRDQAVFRLKIGPPDDGSDNGDPHLHTVNGQRYDFQAVGEFILLRDRDGLELQARQSPVPTANPLPDAYSGLKACVSLNTAFAARVGRHRISFQPAGHIGGLGAAGMERLDDVGLDATVDSGDEPRMHFYIDGRLAQLAGRQHRFDGNVVSGFETGGGTGLRIDYLQGAVVLVTPHFWNSHQMWYLNISVSHTQADEGLMGPIDRTHWLPRLPSGRRFGPRPKDPQDRYRELYRLLADAWRVTDRSSLFTYAPGTSTATFTDRDWPAEQPPCTVKPGFEIPGAPLPAGMDIAAAEAACQVVADAGLKQDCIFDVATTGDVAFAAAYRLVQDLRRKATAVQVVQVGLRCVVAIVTRLVPDQPMPRGSVRFTLGGSPIGDPVPLDAKGRAEWCADDLAPGIYDVSATFLPTDGDGGATPSASPVIRLHADRGDGTGPTPTAPPCPCLPIWLLWVLLVIILVLLIGLIAVLVAS